MRLRQRPANDSETVFRFRDVRRDPLHLDRILTCSNFFDNAAMTGYAYQYDILGRPVSRNSDTFAYDRVGLVTNTNKIENFWGSDLSGTLQGAGGVGGLVAVSIAGQYYFPCYDNLGNIVAYVDESGVKVASYTYDAFGYTLSSSGSLQYTFPHRFSTKYRDEYSWFYDYGYRWYWPEYGRWLSRDPIGEEGGENLYVFCRNASISRTDSLGQRIWISSSEEEGRVSVSIRATLQFDFPCKEKVSKKLAEDVVSAIKKGWSQTVSFNKKTYTVSVDFIQVKGFLHSHKWNWNNDYHTFRLVEKSPAYNTNSHHWDTSHVDQKGGAYAEIFADKHNDTSAYVHEFGHMLGLDEKYYETTPYDIHTGRTIRVTTPYCGFENHIMADVGDLISGGEVFQIATQSPFAYNIGLPRFWSP